MVRSEEFRNAAISILQGSRTPLHFERIADRAIAKRILLSNADTLAAYMGAVLEYDVGRYKSQSAFVQTSQDHYSLNQKLSQIMPVIDEGERMPVTAKFRSAAINILRGSIGSLSFEHISSRAISEGMIRPNVHTIAALMGEVLQEDIFQHHKKSPFVKTKEDHYGLNPSYPYAKASRPTPKSPGSIYVPFTPPITSSKHIQHSKFPTTFSSSISEHQYKITKPPYPKPRASEFHKINSGKAGEYLVMSKLLFLNYTVGTPSVDVGVDLFVTGDDHKVRYIQVKTMLNDNNICRALIKHKSFNRYANNNMFYVFVFRDPPTEKTRERFLIFRHSALKSSLSHLNIPTDKDINLTFFNADDNFWLEGLDVTDALDNWELLL